MTEKNHANTVTVGADRFSTTEIKAANDYINSHVTAHQLNLLDVDSNIRFDCQRWQVGGFQVCDFSYGDCEVEVTVDKCEEHGFFIVIPMSGYANVISKERSFSLQPGLAMAFTTSEAESTKFRDSTSFRNINICASYHTLQSFLTSEFQLPITRDITFPAEPMIVNNEFRFLLNYIEWFSSQLNSDTVSMIHGRANLAKHMYDMLMSFLVSTVENNYQELYDPKNDKGPAPIFVRLAEEYIRDNATEPITISDIAQEVGVAVRTLHNGFQQYRNYSISEFMRNQRLSLARIELATAKQKNLSVTDVAYACGFVHLSKFALAYQKKYGEKPSETRRKGSY